MLGEIDLRGVTSEREIVAKVREAAAHAKARRVDSGPRMGSESLGGQAVSRLPRHFERGPG